MITGQANRATLVATSRPVKAKIMTFVQGVVFPASGELRSIPAEVSGTGRSQKIRNPTSKEHPVEPSVSALPMEPAREPGYAANLGPTSQI